MIDVIRDWRLQKERYRLRGKVCQECKVGIFPPRDICPNCSGTDLKDYKFSGKGEIYSLAIVHEAPEGFEENAPYYVALVRLNEGPLLVAQVTDIDPDHEPGIGTPLEMVTRILMKNGQKGALTYGYKFRPSLPSAMEASRSSK